MPNKNYLSGRRFEYQVKKDLEKEGYHVIRASGSHGAYDLIAIYTNLTGACVIRCIQCKVAKTKRTLEGLRKKFRQESPLKAPFVSSTSLIQPELCVKIYGQGDYFTYGMEID